MWELWWTKRHWDRLFSLRVLQLSPVSIISPMLHVRLHLHVAHTRRTDTWSLGTFQKSNALPKIGKCWIQQHFHFFFPSSKKNQSANYKLYPGTCTTPMCVSSSKTLLIKILNAQLTNRYDSEAVHPSSYLHVPFPYAQFSYSFLDFQKALSHSPMYFLFPTWQLHIQLIPNSLI